MSRFRSTVPVLSRLKYGSFFFFPAIATRSPPDLLRSSPNLAAIAPILNCPSSVASQRPANGQPIGPAHLTQPIQNWPDPTRSRTCHLAWFRICRPTDERISIDISIGLAGWLAGWLANQKRRLLLNSFNSSKRRRWAPKASAANQRLRRSGRGSGLESFGGAPDQLASKRDLLKDEENFLPMQPSS